jgi:hypothetical protein
VAQQRREDIYIQAGETANSRTHFSADRIAAAFEIEHERVIRALIGEFGLGPDGMVGAVMAQHLAEVLLGDLPQDQRQAALMRLGGFTPRHDATEGIGDGPPTEESDRQAAVAGIPDDELASRRSSHDPATNDAI